MTPDEGMVPLVCACASLRRAARAVTQTYEEELRPAGSRPTQFTLLWTLSRKGEMRQADLGDFLALDRTTLSRTLAPLAKRGWLGARAGDDKRQSLWSLTPAGRREVARVEPLWLQAQQRLRERLGAERFEALLTDLAVVAGAARHVSAARLQS